MTDELLLLKIGDVYLRLSIGRSYVYGSSSPELFRACAWEVRDVYWFATRKSSSRS